MIAPNNFVKKWPIRLLANVFHSSRMSHLSQECSFFPKLHSSRSVVFCVHVATILSRV